MELLYNNAEALLSTKEVAEWYLTQISLNYLFFFEYLFYTEMEIRVIITGLIGQALKHCTNFEVGKSVLEQLAFYIGKRNMYPAAKIFNIAARSHKQYEKIMKEIGLGDIVVAVVKLKESKGQKALEGTLKNGVSEFSCTYTQYTERNLLDSIDFLQAIENLKVNFTEDDLEPSILKRLKKTKTQNSLAMIISKKNADIEQLTKMEQILIEGLIKMEANPATENYIIDFYIALAEQLAKIEDQHT